MTVQGPEPWHGTRNGYTNYGCRCDDCKVAQAAYMKEYRSRPEYREWRRKQLKRWRDHRRVS